MSYFKMSIHRLDPITGEILSSTAVIVPAAVFHALAAGEPSPVADSVVLAVAEFDEQDRVLAEVAVQGEYV